VFYQITNIAIELDYSVRRTPVGIDAEGIGGLLFEEIGCLPKLLGNPAVCFYHCLVHGY
jgi:hypothetical protein